MKTVDDLDSFAQTIDRQQLTGLLALNLVFSSVRLRNVGRYFIIFSYCQSMRFELFVGLHKCGAESSRDEGEETKYEATCGPICRGLEVRRQGASRIGRDDQVRHLSASQLWRLAGASGELRRRLCSRFNQSSDRCDNLEMAAGCAGCEAQGHSGKVAGTFRCAAGGWELTAIIPHWMAIGIG